MQTSQLPQPIGKGGKYYVKTTAHWNERTKQSYATDKLWLLLLSCVHPFLKMASVNCELVYLGQVSHPDEIPV